MDYADLTQAALQALQPSIAETTHTIDDDEVYSLCGRILGVLIRKSRLEAERTQEECARFLRVEPQLIESWEFGDRVPSMPQLELLARFLKGNMSDNGFGPASEKFTAQEEYIVLRGRLIGGMLREARNAMGQSIDELSAKTGLDGDLLESYEFGETTIPVSHLTVLAQAVKRDLSYFTEQPFNATDSDKMGSVWPASTADDNELSQFVADSENRDFIRLAMAFRHLERANLHQIADALFAIIRARGDSNGWSPPSS